jgi:hypothetical protein
MQTHAPRPKPGDLIEIRDQLGVVKHLFGTRCYFWPARIVNDEVKSDRRVLLKVNTNLALVVPRPGELERRKAAEKEISLSKVAENPKRNDEPGIKQVPAPKRCGRNGRWRPWID